MTKTILALTLACFALGAATPTFAADKKCKKGMVLDKKSGKCKKK